MPLKVTSPSVASYNLNRVLPSVDFPHPDSPTMPNVSPSLINRETSSTALTSPTFLLIKLL